MRIIFLTPIEKNCILFSIYQGGGCHSVFPPVPHPASTRVAGMLFPTNLPPWPLSDGMIQAYKHKPKKFDSGYSI